MKMMNHLHHHHHTPNREAQQSSRRHWQQLMCWWWGQQQRRRRLFRSNNKPPLRQQGVFFLGKNTFWTFWKKMVFLLLLLQAPIISVGCFSLFLFPSRHSTIVHHHHHEGFLQTTRTTRTTAAAAARKHRPPWSIISLSVSTTGAVSAEIPADEEERFEQDEREARQRDFVVFGNLTSSLLSSSNLTQTSSSPQTSRSSRSSFWGTTTATNDGNSNTLSLSQRLPQSILSRTRSSTSSSARRQCFVTGRYPLTVTFRQCPTRKWLRWESHNQVLINGTSITKSLASLHRLQWLDSNERQILVQQHKMTSLEFIAEIHLERPGYVQILPSYTAGSIAARMRQQRQQQPGGKKNCRLSFLQQPNSWKSSTIMTPPLFGQLLQRHDSFLSPVVLEEEEEKKDDDDRLWVTGFSIGGRSGHIYSVDTDLGELESVNGRTKASLLWPNEVTCVPRHIWRKNDNNMMSTGDDDDDDDDTTVNDQVGGQKQQQQQQHASYHQDALLVADGFLVPGKDRGGLYIVKHPGTAEAEWTVRLTSTKDRWFYHRATWIDMTGDGRQSILAARCQVSTSFPTTTNTTTTGKSKRNNNNNNKRARRSCPQFVMDGIAREQFVLDGIVNGMARHQVVMDGIASGISKQGQLVWLECPQPHSIDVATGTPLEEDGTVFDPLASIHLPWKTHVLTTGPDVMFCVVDLDPTDDTIEVLCSEFFTHRVTLKSIRRPSFAGTSATTRTRTNTNNMESDDDDGRPSNPEQHNKHKQDQYHTKEEAAVPKVVFERIVDDRCGAAFGCIPVDLDGELITHDQSMSSSSSSSSYPIVIDSGSTVPYLKPGDTFSHLLVTSHECTYATDETEHGSTSSHPFSSSRKKNDADGQDSSSSFFFPHGKRRGDDQFSGSSVSTTTNNNNGGSLYAYRIPRKKVSGLLNDDDDGKEGIRDTSWKTEPWLRSTVATGFKVEGQLGNMINPGAPGFVYAFHAKEEEDEEDIVDQEDDDEEREGKMQRRSDMNNGRHRRRRRPLIAVAGDCAESAYLFRPKTSLDNDDDKNNNKGHVDDNDKNNKNNKGKDDPSTRYKLMAEIQCQATVGSIGIGYDDFLSLPTQERGYAKLYIPCYEKDKILVFALGSGGTGTDVETTMTTTTTKDEEEDGNDW